MKVSALGEFGLIDRIGRMDAVRGIGDDCAILNPPDGHDLVMTADALIEGVHFRHEWISWERLGARSMAVNVSDLAAMGAQPLGMLITLGLKPDTDAAEIERFYAGAGKRLQPDGAHILGGDIVASPTATAISVTAIGSVERGRAIPRSGARPGDDLYVSGYLGVSAMGLKVLQDGGDDPADEVFRVMHTQVPRTVQMGRAAVASGHVHAMMDISDGLAGDLGHMVRESGVGAILEEDLLPVMPDLPAAAARHGASVLDLVLHGGEDYQLLMAIAPGKGDEVAATRDASERQRHPNLRGLHTRLYRIGRIVEGAGITMLGVDGTERPVEARAYRHF